MTVSSHEVNAATTVPVGQKTQKGGAHPRFLQSLATVFGGQVACALVAIAIEVCYARLLGPAGRGQISLCMMVIAIGVTVGGFGGDIPIMIWAAGRNKKYREWLPAVWFWGLIGCTVTGVAWAVIYLHWRPAFLRGITTDLAIVIAAAVPFGIFFQYLTALFSGLERFRERAVLALLAQVTELMGVVALTLLVSRTAEMAILGNMLGLFIACIFGAVALRESLRDWWKLGPAAEKIGAALNLGLLGQFSSIATFFSYRLDVFVLNYFMGPAQVGLYALGVVVSETLWQVPQAAAVALFPRSARTLDQPGGEFTCFVTRHVFLLACTLGLALGLVSPVMIPLVFGARFKPTVEVIWWILPGTVALAVAKVMAADLTARGKPKCNAMISALAGCVTVLLDLLLIPRLGIRGAALASSMTYVLQAGLIGYTLKHFLQVTWKVLLVPSRSELASYRQISQQGWSRMKCVILPAKSAARTDA